MTNPVRLARVDLPAFAADRHAALWAQVPELWRRETYPIEIDPFASVFSRIKETRVVDLQVGLLSASAGQELMWWVWHCYDQGKRRINAAWLRNVAFALSYHHQKVGGEAVDSILSVTRRELQHAHQESTYARRGRLPAASVVRNVDREVAAIQEVLALRHDRVLWWEQDRWKCREDPRIPVREHEPRYGQSIRFTVIQTPWLRRAAKYYFRVTLETGQYSWGSLLSVIVYLKYFDDFLVSRGLEHPALVSDPRTQLHALMLDYLSVLRSRTTTVGARRGQRLADRTVNQAQLAVAAFYLFMVDHHHELATTTGDPRFGDLTDAHARLWRDSDLPWGGGRVFSDGDGSQYIEDVDLSRMTELIPIVGLARNETATITRNGEQVEVFGLGDPSMMRAWLIQALTGRRASEVLMSDFNPLESVPGITPRPAESGPKEPNEGDDFVARYRYQQTKVRRAPNTILVGRDVVNVIQEQQAWTRERLGIEPGQPHPRCLFPALSTNHKGIHSRSSASYNNVLAELSELVQLKDQHGKLIQFSKSHRLRHTKATNLLNLGAPVHVVVRYMGHRSPEMTMRYAATLAQTAEREFLRTQRVGRDGKDLGVSAQDLYDITALSGRTDRVLPTGLCLLPPTKRCDKGNACYSCEFFATDRTYVEEHQQLLEDTKSLIARRKEQVRERTGREMGEDNIWLGEQLATIRSLELIIASLQSEPSQDAVRGRGVGGRSGYQNSPVSIELTRRITS